MQLAFRLEISRINHRTELKREWQDTLDVEAGFHVRKDFIQRHHVAVSRNFDADLTRFCNSRLRKRRDTRKRETGQNVKNKIHRKLSVWNRRKVTRCYFLSFLFFFLNFISLLESANSSTSTQNSWSLTRIYRALKLRDVMRRHSGKYKRRSRDWITRQWGQEKKR